MQNLYKAAIEIMIESAVKEVSSMLHPDMKLMSVKTTFDYDVANNPVNIKTDMQFIDGSETVHRSVNLAEVTGFELGNYLNKMQVLEDAKNIKIDS